MASDLLVPVPTPSFRFNQVVYHNIDDWARAVLERSPESDHERVIGIYRDFADIALQNAEIAREEADIAREKADIARMAEKPTALLIEDAESWVRKANDLNHKASTYELQASALERATDKPRMRPTATKSTKLRDLVIAERREKLAEKRIANAMAREPKDGGSRRRNKTSKNSKKRSKKSRKNHRRK